MADNKLPYQIKIAVIEVCGTAYFYKQLLFEMFSHVGIPENIYLVHRNEYKFEIARRVIGELENMGEEGYLLQRRLLTELCSLRDVPDSFADRGKGLNALRRLKQLAAEQQMIAAEKLSDMKTRKNNRDEILKGYQDKEARFTLLQRNYWELSTRDDDPQKRGYSLEKLLKDLFDLSGIGFRASYKIAAEQIDGAFSFGAFDYLLEARWRKEPTTLAELNEFRGKVDSKIESTRGVFLSISGFQKDAPERLKQGKKFNLLLMDGADLAIIIERRISLPDALRIKAERAYQEGNIYFALSGCI